MTDEPTCSDCQKTGPEIIKRQVGSKEILLCRQCADRRRAIVGQDVASKPPKSPNKLWGGVNE